MSTQSHVTAYAENPMHDSSREEEVRPLMSSYEFECHDAVRVDEFEEFDNFIIDISKLPEGTKFIKFWRG